ncbi:hypothetical protein [Pseudoalteromonas luteoviolacea]|uniref:Uncharacterized protein n=1 Tax=Pseudoalteromonas luteoviolacea S4054 TaxID=1129367 RepID=A0A0F6AAN1_9GAMM|nr:hypothetical protein [Pseudoalteromonas luteoviolacea]AOT09528.1 hypothetical protein S4054249_17590 [Pseudoalteromonas luteoviolacea]AOT14440.1 hypothetical protein S40542_17560 [Pseudoalteromonas luteoviolacea]AOT19356.1 hypothetical protein S4054_17565 [Pseudoalteromonas luteoviolacea]KKE83213.1 hypothetical protein N479_15325 [Pseudoalteromonas luteoviolacea S4054]KZN68842.1 hypothetical protein N481_23135 [Pseudoalteromonas luteoviolacea S4047-1]
MRVFHLLFAVSLATLLCVTAAGAHAAEERQQVVELIADLDIQYLDIDFDEAVPFVASKSTHYDAEQIGLVFSATFHSQPHSTQIRAPPAH